MADVAWTKLGGVGNSDVFEVAFNATDKTTPVLQLNPTRKTGIAIATTGAATVQIDLYFEDPANSGPTAFTYDTNAATSTDAYMVEIPFPVAGIDLTGTVAGGDTATIQVIQSARE